MRRSRLRTPRSPRYRWLDRSLGRRTAVLVRERLDQAIDPGALDRIVELVAIVGHQAYACDDDVVRLPPLRRLFHAVVDLHRRLSCSRAFGPHDHLALAPLPAPPLVVH